MNIAAVTSPFAYAEEAPWVVWKSQDRVSVLPEQEQTNAGLASSPCVDQSELQPIPPAPHISRMQYNTVMNRIVQASKKTGSFSSWTT